MMDLSWLADQFALVEARESMVTKLSLPAHDADVSKQMAADKTLWGAKVVINPELGRQIRLSYVRRDGKPRLDERKLRKTIPLP